MLPSELGPHLAPKQTQTLVGAHQIRPKKICNFNALRRMALFHTFCHLEIFCIDSLTHSLLRDFCFFSYDYICLKIQRHFCLVTFRRFHFYTFFCTFAGMEIPNSRACVCENKQKANGKIINTRISINKINLFCSAVCFS